ncbi:hypothetical protein C0J52_16641 [Blattella germanica]|nr:hypothetical protein C0J52_16641 [Blattella germanica]
MDKCAKPVFDLSCEISSPQYFKSSFARSMAVDCMNQSKSLDSAFLNLSVTSENYINRSTKSDSVWTKPVKSNKNCKGMTEISDVCSGSKIIQKESDYARVVPLRKTNRDRSHSIDAANLWKTKQDSSISLLQQNDKNSSGHQQNSPKHSHTESDVIRLRKVSTKHSFI